ncbi:MAG: hypothetical protein HY934_08400 [Candidatus Firestonebacteria bacterium]|nr:hypothetical protein [Candidatus Firestonebacteria bacterium]
MLKRGFKIAVVIIITFFIGSLYKSVFAEEEFFMPNMHMQLGCESCHQTPATVGVDTRESVKLTSPNNDVILLCELCHPNQEAHPNGVSPNISNMKVPDYLPLGVKGGPNENKLICTTCHDIHAEFSSGKLLRGFPQKKGERGRYVQKIDLCKDCHGADLLKRSPHKGDDKSCSFCHGVDPKKEEKASTIKMDIISLCNFCHVSERIPHYLKFRDLFTDKDIKEDLKKMTLPLSKDKKLTCATCHNPHGNENPKRHYLREELILIAGKSNKINPHWTDIFCPSCHEGNQEKGKEAIFKFNNNTDKTCMWCHQDDEGASLHPYSIPAKDSNFTKIQRDKMKIVNDTISCITCHAKDCEKKAIETGKNFLRSAPYEYRNTICFNCHILEIFKKINPHRQKDMQGKVDYEACKHCHVGIPDEEKKENLGLKGKELFLCLRCHPDRPHPGTDIKTGQGIEHMIVPKEVPNKMVIPKDMPLDKKGRIMCGSCHPSHLPGITSKTQKVRMQNECTDCHIGI